MGDLLEVFDDVDLPGQLGFGDASFPSADGVGVQPIKSHIVIEIEILYQLFLGEATVFSTGFEVFVELQKRPCFFVCEFDYSECGV